MGVARSADVSSYVTDSDDFDIDSRPAASSAPAVGVSSGWEEAEKINAPTGEGYPVEFKHSESLQLIKFIDENGPFATYSQHFLQQKTEGRRSYVCIGAGCPLCEKLKHKPEKKTAFSIVNFTDGTPQRQQLIATPRLFKALHAAEFSPQGPLTKNFWQISRTGKMQQTVYNLNAVKPRDLGEDWGLDPDKVMAQLADFKPFDRSAIKGSTYAELLEIAETFA